MGQLWATNSLGGFLANPKIDKVLQFSAQPILRFRQFTELKNAFGKQSGETFNWDKVANVSTVGGRLIETNTMHQTEQVISKGTMTIYEYGNSIPFTRKLELLSQFDVEEMIKKGLLNDYVKVMDGLVERQMNQCLLRYVGTSASGYALTTDGTAVTNNTSAMNKYHVKNMVDELVKRNVPPWDGEDYICIGSVEAIRGILDDLESAKYYTGEGYKNLLAGEVGRYYGCRFIRDNYATRYTYSETGLTSTIKTGYWDAGSAGSMDAYNFGQGAVAEAVAQPEGVLPKEVTDYGRSKGLAWYFVGGFKIIWDDESNQRIIKWDSAT
jgi:N4-gp56 family major capsid protein